MPKIEQPPAGVLTWIDLTSPDVDAAKAFYGGVFGWDAQDELDDEGNRIYVNLSKDGHDVAGLGEQQPGMEGMPAMWNTYVATDDVDATIELAGEAGATTILPPMDVMTAGRMAVVQAPDGAVVSFWQPGTHTGVGLANEPDTWTWSELLTRDLDAAMPFYAAVAGWDYAAQDMGQGRYEVAAVDGHQHAGLLSMPDQLPEQVPSHWSVSFAVADLEASLAAVAEHGGQAVSPVMDIPGMGRQVTVHDPQGGSFTLFEFAQPSDA